MRGSGASRNAQARSVIGLRRIESFCAFECAREGAAGRPDESEVLFELNRGKRGEGRSPPEGPGGPPAGNGAITANRISPPTGLACRPSVDARVEQEIVNSPTRTKVVVSLAERRFLVRVGRRGRNRMRPVDEAGRENAATTRLFAAQSLDGPAKTSLAIAGRMLRVAADPEQCSGARRFQTLSRQGAAAGRRCATARAHRARRARAAAAVVGHLRLDDDLVP